MQALFLQRGEFYDFSAAEPSVQAAPEQVGVADAVPAEEIERAADGRVNPTVAELIDELEVAEAADAAGVGHRAAAPAGQPVVIDSTLSLSAIYLQRILNIHAVWTV